MPIIPVIQEAERRGLWFEASPGKSTRSYLKSVKKKKTKGLKW
jgi:hypothetical protein